jgi:uncharacterized caspase-like protein
MGLFRHVVVLALAVCWLGCGPAHAEKRVALVIGNSAYKSVPRLANPVNDATLVADMFKKAGFDSVTTKLDVNIADMRKALREFGGQARDADVAVIYYAGHGIELDGNNYLIPIDAALETDTDVLDETFPLDRVLFAVEPARQLRLVILDACRDNPFSRNMKRTIASRGIGRGLAKVEPNNPNTMIAFAAKAGSTASDGDSRNSPFAASLVEHLPKPGLDLRKAFGFVRDDVLRKTSYQQEPYVYGSLGGNDVPLVPAKPIAAGPQPNPQDTVRKDYELALQLGTRDGWNAFLAQYPEGFYASLARGQLNKITAEEARATATQKAQLAEQEKARLAVEGAKRAEQERAAADAKAAEKARIVAEEAKQAAQAKAEAEEQARLAAEKALADRIAADKADAERQAAAKAVESPGSDPVAQQAVQKQAADPPAQKDEEPQKLASLTPPSDQPASSLSAAIVARSLQAELRRVGCLTGPADGDWNTASQRSLTLFNKYAGTSFGVTLASVDALDAIKIKPSRVCPMICNRGYKADGDSCVKMACKPGYRIGDDNSCEKIESKRPVAARETPPAESQRVAPQATSPERRAQSSGQIICNRQGCRPVKPGCVVTTTRRPEDGQVEKCF